MARPSLDSFVGTPQATKPALSTFESTPTSPAPKTSLQKFDSGLNTAAKAVSSVFPGGQIGKAVGETAYSVWQSIATRSLDPVKQQAKANDANMRRIFGDAASAVLTPASFALTGPAGSGAANIAGRIGVNAAVGAGLGASQAVATNKDVGTAALTGGAVGGAFSGAGELISAGLSKLPARLVKQALPKLTPGNEEYALRNTRVASIPKLIVDSRNSINELGAEVSTVLKTKYKGNVGAGNSSIQQTLEQFSDSAYTPDYVVKTLKSLVPTRAKLIDKVADGTATLYEKNVLRKSVDPIIKKVFTDHPQVSSKKEVAAAFANALRREVQTSAPETQPLFANMSKEIDLKNALSDMAKRLEDRKALGLYDIVAGLGGFTTLGPVGAAGAIAFEKAARSPGVGLGAAKVFEGIANTTPAAANALKTPATSALVGLQPDLPQSPTESQIGFPSPDTTTPLSGSMFEPGITREEGIERAKDAAFKVDPSGTVGAVKKVGGKALASASETLRDAIIQKLSSPARVPKAGKTLDLDLMQEKEEILKVLQKTASPTQAQINQALEVLRLEGQDVSKLAKEFIAHAQKDFERLRDSIGRFTK